MFFWVLGFLVGGDSFLYLGFVLYRHWFIGLELSNHRSIPHNIAGAVAFMTVVALTLATWRTIALALIGHIVDAPCAKFRLRVLFQYLHVCLQFGKAFVDAHDQWLNQIWKRILDVLYDSQRHLDHGFHSDRFQGSRRTTFYRFAPITNAFLVFVDLLMLNLNHSNDHFAFITNLFHESQNRFCVFATQVLIRDCLGCNCIQFIKSTFDFKQMFGQQRRALGDDSKWMLFHFFSVNESNKGLL